MSKELESAKNSIEGLNSDIDFNKSKLEAMDSTDTGPQDDLSAKKAELASANKSIEGLVGDLVMNEEGISSTKESID